MKALFFKLPCMLKAAMLFILRLRFKFEPWHIKGNFYCRPYKLQVIQYMNKRGFQTVVEYGCGLGDISSRLECDNLYCFDRSPSAVDAFNFLNSKLRSEVKSLGSPIDISLKVDCVMLVNFLTILTPEDLKDSFERMIEDLCPDFIFLDIVYPFSGVFSNSHPDVFFEEYGVIVERFPCVDGMRDFALLKVGL